MRIALCQLNPVVGDIEGNKLKILSYYGRAAAEGADLAIFPELFLCGYPPLDLIEKREFRNKVLSANLEIASRTGATGLIFGSLTEDHDDIGTDVYNSAVLCYDGRIQFVQNKTLIPNYDVFDEIRYFEPSKEVTTHRFREENLGISVCEDIWNDADYWNKRRYSSDPVHKQINQGATLLINISASPYAYGKRKERRRMLSVLTAGDKIPLVYVCCVGGQTDLIFDGASMIFNSRGEVCFLAEAFKEDFRIADTKSAHPPVTEVEKSYEEEVLRALIFGVQEYFSKNGFERALIGLSGGIDSSLVTYIAVKALGKENVHCLLMPSKYSSAGSVDDSIALVNRLGCSYEIISIQKLFDEILTALSGSFGGLSHDVTEENIQSRIRGLILMAVSNKLGRILLTTGNKSEIAVGYATLYGDMCGALAVIGDVYKTDVYRICGFINNQEEIIPESILFKAPSAELRYNQKDQDTLPPYGQLDEILKMYLEQNREIIEISRLIGDEKVVNRVLMMVDKSEFKRKQAAPVIRVSTKAFGYGRRFPIVQGWRRSTDN